MAVAAMSGQELARRLEEALAGAVERWDADAVWVRPERVTEVARFLREDPSLDFQFLSSISAVDFVDYFQVVYHLTSMGQQRTAIVKTRVYGRVSPALPSVYPVWRGADFQEREIWDLMGVRFQGHPNMKRLLLWEGFEGHPLRKDYL